MSVIRNYTDADGDALFRLWNTAGSKNMYAPQSREGFDAIMLKHPYFSADHTFVLDEGGAVCGFVNGVTGDDIARGAERGYVSCVILDDEHDMDENAALLLDALEDSFRKKGKIHAAVTCFNPIQLPWLIPGTDAHQHNNMPGIAKDNVLYERMLHRGYTEGAAEQAMHMELKDFAMPEAMLKKAERMAAEGYTVDFYDPAKHTGFNEMVESLGNSMWSAELPGAAASGLLMPVALCGNTVAGFAGPVYPQPTGRGYFAGIAVGEQFRGHGLGKLLFYRLCEAEKACGAKYMSLFTGADNPARFIYHEAGFEVRRFYAVMIKEL